MADQNVAHPMRVCRKCGAEKPLTPEFFSRAKTHAAGLNARCKVCSAASAKARRESDPERARKRQRLAQARYREKHRGSAVWKEAVSRHNKIFRERHPDKVRENNKRWREANPEKVRASIKSSISKKKEYYAVLSKDWAARNRDKCRKAVDKHRRANLEQDRLKSAKWRASNPDKVREMKARQYARIKSEAGTAWVRQRLSNCIRQSLRRAIAGGGKNRQRWTNLVGYDVHELIRHIERQFQKGMCWQNWGKFWHLDHIRPVSSFDISSCDSQEFRDCWALTNLRPIPITENLSKSKKQIFLI